MPRFVVATNDRHTRVACFIAIGYAINILRLIPCKTWQQQKIYSISPAALNTQVISMNIAHCSLCIYFVPVGQLSLLKSVTGATKKQPRKITTFKLNHFLYASVILLTNSILQLTVMKLFLKNQLI